MSSAICFNLVQSKILLSGNGLFDSISFHLYLINPSPDHKILAWSKLKAFADDKIDVKMMISLLDRVENNVGKGENAGPFRIFQKNIVYIAKILYHITNKSGHSKSVLIISSLAWMFLSVPLFQLSDT